MTTLEQVLLTLLLLQTKHLIVDWLWQTPYELANKGTYGHAGGIQHAAKHAVLTVFCFAFLLNPIPLVGVFCIDFLMMLELLTYP